MKKTLVPTLILLLTITIITACGNKSDSKGTSKQAKSGYDFDASKYKYNTQLELVNAFMQTLAAKDTATLIQYLINEEVISYAATIMDKEDTMPIEKKVEKATKELNNKMKACWGTTVRNLVTMLNEATIDLSNSTVTVDTSLSEPFKGVPSILHSKATVRILSKDQKYHKLDIYSLLRVKGKWFILGPKWNLDGKSVPNRPQ